MHFPSPVAQANKEKNGGKQEHFEEKTIMKNKVSKKFYYLYSDIWENITF